MYKTLLIENNNGILTITVNRPEKMNALNQEVIEELGVVLENIYQDSQIQVVILTGAGEKAFVAGADISEFPKMNDTEGAALARKGRDLVFDKIENSPKPVIAAVNGFALGGGCELAMCCHFRVASVSAKFGQPEVNLGLIPGYGGTQRLTQLIGKGRAMEMMMTGDMITAEEAQQLGLVNHVFAVEALLSETVKIAGKIQKKAPLAISRIIASVNEAARCDDNGFDNEIDRFGSCFATSDMREGVQAFIEKRKPSFAGK